MRGYISWFYICWSLLKSLPKTWYKLRSASVFAGKQILGLDGPVQLHTEDGCDIDDDIGLSYVVNEKQTLIFDNADSENRPDAISTDANIDSITSWPAVYSLPQLNSTIKDQILACKTPDDAAVLKCNTNLLSALLKSIADDLRNFVAKDGKVSSFFSKNAECLYYIPLIPLSLSRYLNNFSQFYCRYLKSYQYKAIGDAILREFPILLDGDGSWESSLIFEL